MKTIAVPAGYAGLIPRGDELLNVDLETGRPVVTHINLNTCETRTEDIGGAPPGAKAVAAISAPVRRSSAKAGLPLGMPGRDAGKVMDPKKVAEQAQHLSYAARIALPAVLANNMNQERTLAAAGDQPNGALRRPQPTPLPQWRIRSSPPKKALCSSPSSCWSRVSPRARR